MRDEIASQIDGNKPVADVTAFAAAPKTGASHPMGGGHKTTAPVTGTPARRS